MYDQKYPVAQWADEWRLERRKGPANHTTISKQDVWEGSLPKAYTCLVSTKNIDLGWSFAIADSNITKSWIQTTFDLNFAIVRMNTVPFETVTRIQSFSTPTNLAYPVCFPVDQHRWAANTSWSGLGVSRGSGPGEEVNYYTTRTKSIRGRNLCILYSPIGAIKHVRFVFSDRARFTDLETCLAQRHNLKFSVIINPPPPPIKKEKKRENVDIQILALLLLLTDERDD